MRPSTRYLRVLVVLALLLCFAPLPGCTKAPDDSPQSFTTTGDFSTPFQFQIDNYVRRQNPAVYVSPLRPAGHRPKALFVPFRMMQQTAGALTGGGPDHPPVLADLALAQCLSDAAIRAGSRSLRSAARSVSGPQGRRRARHRRLYQPFHGWGVRRRELRLPCGGDLRRQVRPADLVAGAGRPDGSPSGARLLPLLHQGTESGGRGRASSCAHWPGTWATRSSTGSILPSGRSRARAAASSTARAFSPSAGPDRPCPTRSKTPAVLAAGVFLSGSAPSAGTPILPFSRATSRRQPLAPSACTCGRIFSQKILPSS